MLPWIHHKAPAFIKPELVVPVTSCIGLRGYFVVELIHSRTGLIKRRLEFPNVITNAGLNGIGNVNSVSNLIQWCGVGTDNTPPDVSDTALGSQLGNRTNSNGGISDDLVSGPDFDYWEFIRVREFAENEANGNLTEVGFFSASSGGVMYTRQLFLDSEGSPTTIVKTTDDRLRITYKHRAYPNKTAKVQNINVNGVPTTVTSRIQELDSPDHAGGLAWNIGSWGSGARAVETNILPDVNGSFGGNTVGVSSGSYAAYSSNSFFREYTGVWNPSVANFATGVGGIENWHITSFGVNPRMCQATVFDPKIPKDNTRRLTFVVRHQWARATI